MCFELFRNMITRGGEVDCMLYILLESLMIVTEYEG